MPKGQSLHIGLNYVDPDHYDGWNGELFACEADAKDMRAIAVKREFSTVILLREEATAAAVSRAIEGAANELKRGDIFLLTYSGHGGQVQDLNGDDEDGKDETWCCYDRELVDDEIYELLGRFAEGVRVLVLSDSCHSGSVTRAARPRAIGGRRIRGMSPVLARRVEEKNAGLYRGIQKAHKSAENTPIGASVLLISGCMDTQESLDGDRNGFFTENLKNVWNGGRFKGSHKRFRDVIASKMTKTQVPNYYRVGTIDAAFEAQRPFTI